MVRRPQTHDRERADRAEQRRRAPQEEDGRAGHAFVHLPTSPAAAAGQTSQEASTTDAPSSALIATYGRDWRLATLGWVKPRTEQVNVGEAAGTAVGVVGEVVDVVGDGRDDPRVVLRVRVGHEVTGACVRRLCDDARFRWWPDIIALRARGPLKRLGTGVCSSSLSSASSSGSS